MAAYHLRQSFKPGEITPELANKIGYDLAMSLTKGKHAFIVCTYVDKHHVYSHIVFKSTALDCTCRFKNFCNGTSALMAKPAKFTLSIKTAVQKATTILYRAYPAIEKNAGGPVWPAGGGKNAVDKPRAGWYRGIDAQAKAAFASFCGNFCRRVQKIIQITVQRRSAVSREAMKGFETASLSSLGRGPMPWSLCAGSFSPLSFLYGPKAERTTKKGPIHEKTGIL